MSVQGSFSGADAVKQMKSEEEYYIYKYETHCHTSQSSACATADGEAQAFFYKARGYKGIFVTDHFVNGNTTARQDMTWEEKIDVLCSGYEAAKKAGGSIGLDVFLGWEYGYGGSDFLTYGLDKEWLLKNPQVMQMSVNEYCGFVRSEGGFIVHAHPFREDWYIDHIRLYPRACGGCEVINSCRKPIENSMASVYADMYGMKRLAGSDNHHAKQARLSGIRTHEPITGGRDLIEKIMREDYRIFDDDPDRPAAENSFAGQTQTAHWVEVDKL